MDEPDAEEEAPELTGGRYAEEAEEEPGDGLAQEEQVERKDARYEDDDVDDVGNEEKAEVAEDEPELFVSWSRDKRGNYIPHHRYAKPQKSMDIPKELPQEPPKHDTWQGSDPCTIHSLSWFYLF